MLRESLNPETTIIGLETKALAGVIFVTVVADEPLAAEVRGLGLKPGCYSSQTRPAKASTP